MAPRTLQLPRKHGRTPDRRTWLRVGILAPPWLPVPPPAYGGTENVINTLATGLVASGHEVILYTTGEAACPVPREWTYRKALGVGGGGSAAEIRHVIDGYAAFLRAGVDVVHDHTLAGPLYARWLPDLPVVTTNHGPFDSALNGFYGAVSKSISVIAISGNQAASANAGTVAAVVPHGIDLDTVPFGRGGGEYAAFLGRMHPDKGVDLAVDVARAAGVPLRIAAKMREPHELEYFETEIRPRLGPDVEFVGEVSGPDKYRFLGDAMCLLNPIRWAEPFGMVMIESLACGTPVVATGAGSVPEIVENGVTGFVRRRPESLVAALSLVDTIDRYRCRRSVAERFSSGRMVNAHERVYRAAISAMTRKVSADDPHRQRAVGAASP